MALNAEEKDTLKKKIQRLEWWPEETPENVLFWAGDNGVEKEELSGYVKELCIDPDYVSERLWNNGPPGDFFYRNQDVIGDILADFEEYRQSNLGPDEKVAFITCCNNDTEYSEMKAWIDRLWVPEGMELEYIKITGAGSMCDGYNEAMGKSKARFKVYLHQDVRILNPFFIFDLIDVFRRHPKAGMIGMMGSATVPESGIMWQAERFGAVVHVGLDDNDRTECYHERVSCGEDFSAALSDGFIMITREDIPWRSDILKGWHFYDASQSMEFTKRGYEIIIPEQKVAWCMHDFGRINWDNYDAARQIFVANYIDVR